MVLLGGAVENLDAARKLAQEKIEDGSAWERFRDLVDAQSGDLSYVDNPEKLPEAQFQENIQAEFFTYFLKGTGEWTVEEAYTFQTGSNKWKDYSTWPPENVEEQKLKLIK